MLDLTPTGSHRGRLETRGTDGLSDPSITVRKGAGWFAKPNRQDLEDQDRAFHIRNTALMGALANTGLQHVSITGFDAITGTSEHIEEALRRFPMESRTYAVAVDVIQPTLQIMAESVIAVQQAVARVMIATLSR